MRKFLRNVTEFALLLSTGFILGLPFALAMHLPPAMAVLLGLVLLGVATG